MILELLGTRIIGPYYGVSLYVWSSLITVTLISLAFGYWLGGFVADRKPRANSLYSIILFTGLCILIIPVINVPILKFTTPLGLRWGALIASFILFSLPLLLLGMVTPYAIKLCTTELRRVGITTGRLYAISTLGSFGGTILTGFILIPNMGVKKILYLLALILLLTASGGFVQGKQYGTSIISLILVFVCLPNMFIPPKLLDTPRAKVIYKSESLYGQIKVVDKGRMRCLLMDGASQTLIDKKTGISAFEYIHYLQLLRFYHPKGRRLLLIGLGGGSIPRAFADYGFKIDIVEIDPKVEFVARKYFDFGKKYGNVYIQDGREYLQTTNKKYDFIILDASLGGNPAPFHLVTLEVFSRIKELLFENGVFAMNYLGFLKGENSIAWESLYKTLKLTFPFLEVYSTEEGERLENILFFGSKKELRIKVDIERECRDKLIRKLLLQMLKKRVEYSGKEGVVLTDDYNPIEFWTVSNSEAWRRNMLETMGTDILLD